MLKKQIEGLLKGENRLLKPSSVNFWGPFTWRMGWEGLVSVVHNHGDRVRPLRIGLWDPFQMAFYVVLMRVFLSTYKSWDPPSRFSWLRLLPVELDLLKSPFLFLFQGKSKKRTLRFNAVPIGIFHKNMKFVGVLAWRLVVKTSNLKGRNHGLQTANGSTAYPGSPRLLK